MPEEQLWKLWHGDSHLIADDKRNWKQLCPTFTYVVDKMRDYFDMDIKVTIIFVTRKSYKMMSGVRILL